MVVSHKAKAQAHELQLGKGPYETILICGR